MSNEFYNPSGAPSTGSSGTSAPIRSEFQAIATAFDKLPALTGNANELVCVDSSGSALTSIPASSALTQIGALPAAGGTLTGSLAISGASSELRLGNPTGRTLSSVSSLFQIEGTDTKARGLLVRNSNDTAGPVLALGKSRSTSVGGHALVSSGDSLGLIDFMGGDGDEMIIGARVQAITDSGATPGASDMPTRLSFSTTPDGSASLAERMRISAGGGVEIGNSFSSGTSFKVSYQNVGLSTAAMATFLFAPPTGSGTSRTLSVQPGGFGTQTSHTGVHLTSGGFSGLCGTLMGAWVDNAFDPGTALATNVYGVRLGLMLDTNRFNLYVDGTAPSFFDGPIYLGDTDATMDETKVVLSPATGVVASYSSFDANFEAYKPTGPTNTIFFRMLENGTQIGSITRASSSTVAYNTTSDYRLKEERGMITGALDRLDALRPIRFAFRGEPDVEMDGFLAHEVADVVPIAVAGAKDAVDADGAIVPQGLDHSKLVPLMVAAMQELTDRVRQLESLH